MSRFALSFPAMDTDVGTELFVSYENDFNLIIADISAKLESLKDIDGKLHKPAINAAERAVEEAEEIVMTFPNNQFSSTYANIVSRLVKWKLKL